MRRGYSPTFEACMPHFESFSALFLECVLFYKRKVYKNIMAQNRGNLILNFLMKLEPCIILKLLLSNLRRI